MTTDLDTSAASSMSGEQPTTEDPRIDEACTLHARSVEARAAGRLAEAEELAWLAVARMSAAAGAGHPDVANILINLGGVCEDACDYAQAERHYRRAVTILEALPEGVGEDVDRLRVQGWMHLANQVRHMGRYEEAEPILE